MFGIRLFLIGIVATAIAGGGFYVFKLQKDNAILKANAIKMESAISEQKELIENQKNLSLVEIRYWQKHHLLILVLLSVMT